ncbi:MAG: hypothetical protein QOD11_1220 [Bradyrhizobium sp.]|nr:hypothetical protein [Thermoleophilaceae bacterium]MEA2886860.1 hypothetical protein [Bradyrhizobium sp.]
MASSFVALEGTRAADLPVKSKAVEYVRICSLYGAGFFYIPGTDTCIKLGGFLRVDSTFNGSLYDQPAWSGDLGQGNRYRDYFSTRSRFGFNIDTRTATEYGVVRTFGQTSFQFAIQGNNTVNPVLFTGSPSTGTATALLNQPGEGWAAVDMVFIQFAGFTFGKSYSAYASPWNGYPGNITSYLLGGHDTVTGVNNIQYTAQFGNGVSGTIGLDDPVVFNRTAVYNLGYGLNATGNGANAYAGVHAPDVVGNIRVDQTWGLFQVSGALHEVSGSYDFLNGVAVPAGAQGPAAGSPTALSEIGGHPDTKWGGSVMAALQIKNIPTGAGDDLKIDASYALGDTKQVISTSAASPSFMMFSGTGRAGAYQSIGFGATTDAVWLPNHPTTGAVNQAGIFGDNQLKLTEAYGIRGAFNHNWDPYWSSSLFGSYSSVRYDGIARANICAAYTGTKVVSADYSCNPNFNVSQLGVITRWTPIKGFLFSVEIMWFHLDQMFTGTAVLSPTAPKPTATYQFKDQNTVSLHLRTQRNF